MYQYELPLSKFLTANEKISEIFTREGNGSDTIERHELQSISTFFDCLNAQLDRNSLTDKLLADICHRSHQAHSLARLYLDKTLAAEYEKFRYDSLSISKQQEVATCIQLGVDASRFDTPSVGLSNHYSRDFKARFAKAICLHALTVASHKHARASKVLTSDEQEKVVDAVISVWYKQFDDIPLQCKLDCLEVYDFLYIFILTKIVHPESLEIWCRDSMDIWDEPNEPILIQWLIVVGHFAHGLQPHDFLKLVLGGSWLPDAKYPSDRKKYMLERGIIENIIDGNMDWWTSFGKVAMVRAVDSNPRQWVNVADEWAAWWEKARYEAGSPFSRNFCWLGLEKSGISSGE